MPSFARRSALRKWIDQISLKMHDVGVFVAFSTKAMVGEYSKRRSILTENARFQNRDAGSACYSGQVLEQQNADPVMVNRRQLR
jgi:hypothetical protein